MATLVEFEDVLFDSEPIGLAEEFTDFKSPVRVIIISDEVPDNDAEIFFGIPTSIGDIAEVKARVIGIDDSDPDAVKITVDALAGDSTLTEVTQKTLSGQSSQNEEEKEGPVWGLGLKQMNGTYAVLVNSPGGVLTAEQLATIAEISSDGPGIVKLTHAQRTVILLGADQLEAAKEKLESKGLRVGVLHHGIRNIRACCGALCRFSNGTDAVSMAQKLDEELFGRGTTFDIKIAVSDCMRNCSESYCADIGLLGSEAGYTIVAGGRGSQVPFRALIAEKSVPQDKIVSKVIAILNWYESNAKPRERLWKTLTRLGCEAVADTDLSGLQSTVDSFGDGIDDITRTREHLARLAGIQSLRQAMQSA